MPTDYDAPRKTDTDETSDTVQEFTAARADVRSGLIDADEDASVTGPLELPGADLSDMSGEELTMPVVAKRSDEFTCTSCFLVQHRTRLAHHSNARLLCRDCAEI